MAGLTREGFTSLSYAEIVARISSRLEVANPGIDLSPESPDGGLVKIIAFEVAQAWAELKLVYNSNNPKVAEGGGLRNIGLITGIPYGAATRSQVNLQLLGTEGTSIPAGSIVADAKGNEFATQFKATIPSSVQAIAKLSGAIEVNAQTVVNIKSPVEGWDSVTQNSAGKVGTTAQTDVAYRNLRNRTVLHNFTSATEVIEARLLEDLGIDQVTIINNDSGSITMSDGTPPLHIHVTVGEISGVTDTQIATTILAAKGLGCPTFGSTTVTGVLDEQGHPHDVSFSKATEYNIFMDIEITFLDNDYAGAEDLIRADLITHINELAAGEDVVWSRLFGIITPYSKAQIDKLELSIDGVTYSAGNIPLTADRFAATTAGQINILVTN